MNQNQGYQWDISKTKALATRSDLVRLQHGLRAEPALCAQRGDQQRGQQGVGGAKLGVGWKIHGESM